MIALQCIRSYDAARCQVKLKTWIQRHVEWRLLDHIRHDHWMPQRMRASGDWPTHVIVNPEGWGVEASQGAEYDRATFWNYIIDVLPYKQAVAVFQYYYQDVHLIDIGDYLGVTESRACQILLAAKKNLKKKGIDKFEGEGMMPPPERQTPRLAELLREEGDTPKWVCSTR